MSTARWSLEDAHLETGLHTMQLAQFCTLSLIWYDYALTLRQEVEMVWDYPWRFSTVLYVFCRVPLVATPVFLLGLRERESGLRCDVAVRVHSALLVFGHFGVAAMWGLRTIAIWNRDKVVIAVLVILGTPGLVLLAIRVPYIECEDMYGFRISAVAYIAVSFLVVHEWCAYGLGTLRAWRTFGPPGRPWTKAGASSLYRLMFSQGLMYMASIISLSILVATLHSVASGAIARVASSTLLPFSGMVTARFILKLRAWEKGRCTGGPGGLAVNLEALVFVNARSTTVGGGSRLEGVGGFSAATRFVERSFSRTLDELGVVQPEEDDD
ncbi:hypothetical protein FA15DRAFT_667863 [Coprinopsis marcescibilis]|nr:hypothetical protein FA15DRAFT_667863 [Coprinopsis marcescibilis]